MNLPANIKLKNCFNFQSQVVMSNTEKATGIVEVSGSKFQNGHFVWRRIWLQTDVQKSFVEPNGQRMQLVTGLQAKKKIQNLGTPV